MQGKPVKFLYLSEPEMIKAGVLDMKQCVGVVDEVFHLLGKGDYLMGGPRENEHGLMIWFPEKKRFPNMPVEGPDRRFMAMVAYLGGRFNVCGEKWYGSNVANPKKGLPRSILTVMLNDSETSEPLAIMSGNLVSAMRTGAVPGVAAKYLARPGAVSCGCVGAGVINRACLMAIAEGVRTLKRATIYDLDMGKAIAYAKEMTTLLGIEVTPVATLKETIVDADVISVATAGVSKATIPTEWLKEGSLLTLTGTAELTDDVYLENTVIADNWKMHQAWLVEGEEHPKGVESILSWAPSAPIIKLILAGKMTHGDIRSLGDIATGEVPGRKDDKERIVFVTGGMPVEDVGWSYQIYLNAQEKGIGQELKLWDEPHWF
ncbi:MAG TPA: ornithine cyclodeaminase [Deltaproteobacteria bacterium]|nr:ornithine cyclodeaminase [Deltaproteobacteria bacterium]